MLYALTDTSLLNYYAPHNSTLNILFFKFKIIFNGCKKNICSFFIFLFYL